MYEWLQISTKRIINVFVNIRSISIFVKIRNPYSITKKGS